MVIRRDTDGLEGYATWQVAESRIVEGPCTRYSSTNPSVCVARAREDRLVYRSVRGNLILREMEEE